MISGEPLLRAILAAIDEGIHVVNMAGVTVFYNQAASRNDGLYPEEVSGRHLLEVFPSLTTETSTLLKVLHTGQPILNQQQTFANYKGRRVTTINSTYPIVVNGELAGALEVSKDVTRVQELAERVLDLQAVLLQKRPHPGALGQARYTLADLLGQEPRFRYVVEQASRAARGDAPVLVTGETGTGKELLVHAIHRESPRAAGPLIAQNCAALPEGLLEGILFGTAKGSFTGAEDRPGLFELADGGTLFLDELNSLPLGLQVKLLRVLQDGRVRRLGEARERAVNVRIMAACNEDPLRAVEEGRLRRDLFYRINVVCLELPPLRDRRTDIPLLCRHFLNKHRERLGSPAQGLAPAVAEFFAQHSWPGNVRELEHAVEGALALARGTEITMEDLPPSLLRGGGRTAPPAVVASQIGDASVAGTATERARALTLGEGLRHGLSMAERAAILQALEQCDWKVARAARVLGLPRQTLQYRLRILGLTRPGQGAV